MYLSNVVVQSSSWEPGSRSADPGIFKWWVLAPCRQVGSDQRLGETYFLHFRAENCYATKSVPFHSTRRGSGSALLIVALELWSTATCLQIFYPDRKQVITLVWATLPTMCVGGSIQVCRGATCRKVDVWESVLVSLPYDREYSSGHSAVCANYRLRE